MASVASLGSAIGKVKPGSTVGIGGALSLREPMAMIRELVRQETGDLHIVGLAHGIDVELLCGANLVDKAEVSYVGFELDFGLGDLYRRACEDGSVNIKETSCPVVLMQLKAKIQGQPFVVLDQYYSEVLQYHPEYEEIESPFTGKNALALPPIDLDHALIHANKADANGNVHIQPPIASDEILARNADSVLVTAEEVVSNQEMKHLDVTIPYFEIDQVVEQPLGAHPTSCYPDYAYDRAHLDLFNSYLSSAGGVDAYFDDWIFPDEDSYRSSLEPNLEVLRSWRDSDEKWKDVFRAVKSERVE